MMANTKLSSSFVQGKMGKANLPTPRTQTVPNSTAQGVTLPTPLGKPCWPI